MTQQNSITSDTSQPQEFYSKRNVLLAMDHIGYEGKQIHGVTRYFLNVISNSSRHFNIIPCFLRKKNDLHRFFEDQNIDVVYLDRGRFDPRTVFDFVSIVMSKNIQLMHLQGFSATTYGRIAGKLCKIPVIIHQRDVDSAYPKYMVLPDLILSGFTDAGIAVSEYAKDFLVRKRKVNPMKVEVLINPIDIDRLNSIDKEELARLKKSIKYNPNMKCVGMITRFYPVKGVDCFIRAIPMISKKHKDVKYIICGQGPLLKKVKALARELKVEDRVLFAGFVNRPEVWMSLMDIVVSTSYSEGCGNAILEAMALGKAIVSTRSGGPQEILNNQYSALMVDPGDVQGIAAAVSEILGDTVLKQQLSSNAMKSSRQHDVRLYMTKLESIYHKTIHKGNRTS